MIRVADYIYRTLADWGVKHVFMVSGGGAMHLNDALGKEKRIKYICNLHEQACTMGAEGYARIVNQPAVATVTTGPGGTNTITGVMGAWVDSIPMLVLSGQVKTQTTISSCKGLKLRQLGDQEINIIDIVSPITKYARMIDNKMDIRYHLERAWHLSKSGRPGPVWLDIPLDIQAALIEESELHGYDPTEDPEKELKLEDVKFVLERIKKAKRPVIIAGNGVTLAGARDEFISMCNKLRIPILTAISGIDLIPSDSPWFFGRPGILGEHGANFVMQNSDLAVVIGTRMNLRILGYAYQSFARAAYKIMIDADRNEIFKPTLKIDYGVQADAGDFIRKINTEVSDPLSEKKDWLEYCRKVTRKYPVICNEHRTKNQYVSSYYLPEVLAKNLKGSEIIVTGNGTAYTSTFQAIPIKSGIRMFCNVGCASMGYGLPAAIGAAIAANGREVICLTGDGSIQMNIQELQTVLNYKLPLKLFVYNNDGYLSIKITQSTFFNKNFVGSHPASGVILPNMVKIAKAYGFSTWKIKNNRELESKMPEILATEGPVFCEVMLDPFEVLGPKAASTKKTDGTMGSKPLEELSPFLPREELLKNMIIPLLEE